MVRHPENLCAWLLASFSTFVYPPLHSPAVLACCVPPQAVYVPADDLTDPAPATTFAHLDATTVLSRGIAELGIYPAVDPLDSTSRMLDPRILGKEGAVPDVIRVMYALGQRLQAIALPLHLHFVLFVPS